VNDTPFKIKDLLRRRREFRLHPDTSVSLVFLERPGIQLEMSEYDISEITGISIRVVDLGVPTNVSATMVREQGRYWLTLPIVLAVAKTFGIWGYGNDAQNIADQEAVAEKSIAELVPVFNETEFCDAISSATGRALDIIDRKLIEELLDVYAQTIEQTRVYDREADDESDMISTLSARRSDLEFARELLIERAQDLVKQAVQASFVPVAKIVASPAPALATLPPVAPAAAQPVVSRTAFPEPLMPELRTYPHTDMDIYISFANNEFSFVLPELVTEFETGAANHVSEKRFVVKMVILALTKWFRSLKEPARKAVIAYMQGNDNKLPVRLRGNMMTLGDFTYLPEQNLGVIDLHHGLVSVQDRVEMPEKVQEIINYEGAILLEFLDVEPALPIVETAQRHEQIIGKIQGQLDAIPGELTANLVRSMPERHIAHTLAIPDPRILQRVKHQVQAVWSLWALASTGIYFEPSSFAVVYSPYSEYEIKRFGNIVDFTEILVLSPCSNCDTPQLHEKSRSLIDEIGLEPSRVRLEWSSCVNIEGEHYMVNVLEISHDHISKEATFNIVNQWAEASTGVYLIEVNVLDNHDLTFKTELSRPDDEKGAAPQELLSFDLLTIALVLQAILHQPIAMLVLAVIIVGLLCTHSEAVNFNGITGNELDTLLQEVIPDDQNLRNKIISSRPYLGWDDLKRSAPKWLRPRLQEQLGERVVFGEAAAQEYVGRVVHIPMVHETVEDFNFDQKVLERELSQAREQGREFIIVMDLITMYPSETFGTDDLPLYLKIKRAMNDSGFMKTLRDHFESSKPNMQALYDKAAQGEWSKELESCGKPFTLALNRWVHKNRVQVKIENARLEDSLIAAYNQDRTGVVRQMALDTGLYTDEQQAEYLGGMRQTCEWYAFSVARRERNFVKQVAQEAGPERVVIAYYGLEHFRIFERLQEC
ncbi:MAG: hypothetical protein NTY47_02475, partial [Candidatus Omnitrophica bacterium]|nr:hypothetical protein [Candidatus Omnitrophota bacterium]